jgi:hypothetical protein
LRGNIGIFRERHVREIRTPRTRCAQGDLTVIIKRKSNIVLATLQWCSDETGPLSQTSSGFVPNTAKRLSRRASHVGTLIIAHIWGPIRLSEGPLVDGRYGPVGNTKIFDHGPGGKHVAYSVPLTSVNQT